MKDLLCEAFCSQLRVRNVPVGLAIGTNFAGMDGDPIGFYIVGPDASGRYKIEDGGDTVPILEACGADIGLESRGQLFRQLLAEYRVEYDAERGELATASMEESAIGAAAIQFVAMLLRLQDLTFLTKERAESTFREEVERCLIRAIGDRAQIELNACLTPALSEFPIDILVRAPGRTPVAVFLVREGVNLAEAMLFDAEAELKARQECKVIAVLERENSVTKRLHKQAESRITPLDYRGGEALVIDRIVREATGPRHIVVSALPH